MALFCKSVGHEHYYFCCGSSICQGLCVSESTVRHSPPPLMDIVRLEHVDIGAGEACSLGMITARFSSPLQKIEYVSEPFVSFP